MDASVQLHAPAALRGKKNTGSYFIGGQLTPEPIWTLFKVVKYIVNN